nr:transposase [Burkholderia stabilis]
MKTSKFTEEQIAFALKQAELGTKVEEICRKLGISEATFYNWKKKFGVLPANHNPLKINALCNSQNAKPRLIKVAQGPSKFIQTVISL